MEAVSLAAGTASRAEDRSCVLSAEQCNLPAEALPKTVSWCCCAHGRPSIMQTWQQSLLDMHGAITGQAKQ